MRRSKAGGSLHQVSVLRHLEVYREGGGAKRGELKLAGSGLPFTTFFETGSQCVALANLELAM